jgi:gamma-glutamyltranspeptidase/glutathione hydrolase
VAALLVLNVVEPQSSGIGGGAFALVHGPRGLASWDARETAPAAATPELFLSDGEPMRWIDAVPTGRSVGTPGLVRLLDALHARHGRLPWPRLVAPAYRLAREGFPVSPRLAGLTARFRDWLAGTDAAEVFLPGGAPLRAGERLVQPELAATLADLALLGPEAFYAGDGRIARAIADAVARPPMPGALTAADIAAYRAVERAPVCLPWRGHRVCGMGPPSSGATTVAQILGLTARAAPEKGPGPDLWHVFAEASRLAYADRAVYLGDPDAVDVPVAGLLDPNYLNGRAALIDPGHAAPGRADAGQPPGADRGAAPGRARTSPGTTHLSIIDSDGLAISLTASIESAFGSRRMAAGFLLNNQLTDFAFDPAGPDGRPRANAPGPGKRPRSSMSPTIAYRADEDHPALLLGSPGGSRIPEYVAGALIRMVRLGRDPAAAAAGFHVSQRNKGAVTLEEGAAPAALAEALAARGHETKRSAMTSGLHIIRIRPDGTLEGGADPRREGVAAGD